MVDIWDPHVTEGSTVHGNVTQQPLTPSGDEEISRILNLVIRPVLIVFGSIGNSLSFYIMRQGSLKKMSTCFYLSMMAMADTSKYVMCHFYE